LFACGLLTAYLFPSERLQAPWSYISDAMGFSYTAAWSISFYPQFLLNLKRRCSRFLNSEDMNVAEGKHVVTRSI